MIHKDVCCRKHKRFFIDLMKPGGLGGQVLASQKAK